MKDVSASHEALTSEVASLHQKETEKMEVSKTAQATPKAEHKYPAGTSTYSPSWTPSTTRSNFESSAISNEILRDNQLALEKSVQERDEKIAEVKWN